MTDAHLPPPGPVPPGKGPDPLSPRASPVGSLLCDRLRELGVIDTARAAALVEEMGRRVPWGDPEWEAVFRGAAAAPDAALYFLNLSKLCDVLPAEALRQAFRGGAAAPAVGALLGGSAFLPEQLARRGHLFSHLFLEGGIFRPGDPGSLLAEARGAADEAGSEDEVKAALRRMKVREIARIAVRDLAGLAPLPEVTGDLSALASAALAGAVRFGRRQLSARFGAPLVETGDGSRRECRFVVLGMGKLGAGELNFSSDIDLIYLYETDRGQTEGGAERTPLSLHEYFVRLGEQVTRIVSEPTDEGFVFRVDLRLRPEGTRGDLANSLRSAEIYYESWGQTWERAAMIKACPVAGDLDLGEEFLRVITPFVYRKYLDFTAIEEIKELKEKIDRASMRARRDGRDIKLGPGGIREIEFFAQAHQLIYGGKDPSLRLRGTVEALKALVVPGIVTDDERGALEEAYTFWRSLEHRIQVFRERQTHLLPHREEDLHRLARAMGLPDAPELRAEVERHARRVRAIYGRLFRGPAEETAPEIASDAAALLEPEMEEGDVEARLAAMGVPDPKTAARNVAVLREGPPFVRLPARARRYLAKIAPAVLDRALKTPDPSMALQHAERFLSSVGARTLPYALLFENPRVIDALVRLFGSSRFLSGYFLRHPELLDTLIRKDLAALVKTKSDFRKELGESLAACADFEEEMDELRRFKHQETLRVGLHDLAGGLSLEEGMFQLSALAEVLLNYALALARRETARKFGVPASEGEEGKEAAFCVLGMGKLGAEELTYHSDLDIIFIYSGAGESVAPPGTDPSEIRRITNHEYFAKIAQRIISILTTGTREGYVYHLDTRLRPSGNRGPLVTALAAFESYHEKSAQLWERQALLKSRFVAGDRDLGKRAEAIAARFAYERPLPAGAAEEIHRLRRRMEVELGKERPDRLNLKVGRGGVVDVEFAVQYLQLLHGAGRLELRTRSTLKALHELRRAGLLGEEDHRALDEGYRFLRGIEVRLRLAHDASIEQFDPADLSPDERERYGRETERIRGVYLKALGVPD